MGNELNSSMKRRRMATVSKHTDVPKIIRRLGYGVTVIVEGGLFTLGVIEADLSADRPVVIVQVSANRIEFSWMIEERFPVEKWSNLRCFGEFDPVNQRHGSDEAEVTASVCFQFLRFRVT